jgi:hypothetical protein
MVAGISSALVIIKLLDVEAGRLHQDLRQCRDDLAPTGGSNPSSRLLSKSKFICRVVGIASILRCVIACLPDLPSMKLDTGLPKCGVR